MGNCCFNYHQAGIGEEVYFAEHSNTLLFYLLHIWADFGKIDILFSINLNLG